jgi:N-acetylmuramoyl-L-alanine amidase
MTLVRSIQTQDESLDDIPYNFLIGGDGSVYEGRGFSYQGQHTHNLHATEYNSIGICIAFMGNYASIAPSANQINILTDFIRTFVDRDDIDENHIIVAQDDLKYSKTRADSLNDAIKRLENFRPCK